MASLADLLRYKQEVDIMHPVTGEFIKKVWLRILGDFDLNKAYKIARIASSKKRLALRDPSTDDYQDEVMGVIDLSREEKEDLIRTARLSIIVSEAQSVVERPDLPKLESITPDPDAASLEDMEKMDTLESEDEVKYKKEIQEYINTKKLELEEELKIKEEAELNELAKIEVSNIVPYSVFLNEVAEQKILLGVFRDKLCKEREFDNIDDVRNLPKSVKDLLIEKLTLLELGHDEIKN